MRLPGTGTTDSEAKRVFSVARNNVWIDDAGCTPFWKPLGRAEAERVSSQTRQLRQLDEVFVQRDGCQFIRRLV